MSGEGGPIAAGYSFDARTEADVLAYLTRKRANAQTMLDRSPEFQDEARWTIRQFDIIADDIRAGLHRGEAALQADLAAMGAA